MNDGVPQQTLANACDRTNHATMPISAAGDAENFVGGVTQYLRHQQ